VQGNLTNLHSHKYSGLANEKVHYSSIALRNSMLTGTYIPQTIDIAPSPAGIQLTTRKKGASPHTVKKAYVTSTIRNRSGPRRAAGVVAKLAKRGYRPDLRSVSS
jgi:large subunit ribosomal protein L28e